MSDKILNPYTNRYVQRDGRIGRKILNEAFGGGPEMEEEYPDPVKKSLFSSKNVQASVDRWRASPDYPYGTTKTPAKINLRASVARWKASKDYPYGHKD